MRFSSLTFSIVVLSILIFQSESLLLQPSDLGYDGSWERFCDHEETENDFKLYPDHGLKRARLSVCNFHRMNRTTMIESLSMISVCKYGYEIKPHLDDILSNIISKFSQNDTLKREIILHPGPVVEDTVCFTEALAAFDRNCIASMNPFFEMFRQLIARACTSSWLTSKVVLTYVEQSCPDGKRISDEIDWLSLTKNILNKM